MCGETNGKPPVVVMEAGFTSRAEKQLSKGFQKHKKQNQRTMLQEMPEVRQTKIMRVLNQECLVWDFPLM